MAQESLTPNPIVAAEVDCTDLDGFMLNVERLMASELVALSSHEVIAAALFLWCRAWKQRPAASLPNDDRVLSAFARLSLSKFRKVRDEVMRGFVLCSDGRLYHRVLGEEATRAYAKKMAFQGKRHADAERLSKWRASKYEAHNETHSETRFTDVSTDVSSRKDRDRDGTGTGQGRDGTGTNSKTTPSQNPTPAAIASVEPPKVRTANVGEKTPAKSALSWLAYSNAYRERYRSEPVDNAKARALLCRLVDRLGIDEAPAVAAFYVGHNAAWYVKTGHSLDGLVKDAEKLRTEWATGATITDSQARHADRTQGNANVWGRMIAEEESKGQTHEH